MPVVVEVSAALVKMIFPNVLHLQNKPKSKGIFFSQFTFLTTDSGFKNAQVARMQDIFKNVINIQYVCFIPV